jgi:hypothetical protein
MRADAAVHSPSPIPSVLLTSPILPLRQRIASCPKGQARSCPTALCRPTGTPAKLSADPPATVAFSSSRFAYLRAGMGGE